MTWREDSVHSGAPVSIRPGSTVFEVKQKIPQEDIERAKPSNENKSSEFVLLYFRNLSNLFSFLLFLKVGYAFVKLQSILIELLN